MEEAPRLQHLGQRENARAVSSLPAGKAAAQIAT